jgi:hypothetical protein
MVFYEAGSGERFRQLASGCFGNLPASSSARFHPTTMQDSDGQRRSLHPVINGDPLCL